MRYSIIHKCTMSYIYILCCTLRNSFFGLCGALCGSLVRIPCAACAGPCAEPCAVRGFHLASIFAVKQNHWQIHASAHICLYPWREFKLLAGLWVCVLCSYSEDFLSALKRTMCFCTKGFRYALHTSLISL